MSFPNALTKIEEGLQQVYCDKRSFRILDSEISLRKWHADLLDDEGDLCGRMLRGLDSSLSSHECMRWSCQLGIHFGSSKWQDGVLAVGIGNDPQEAYEAACAFFDRSGCTVQAHYFRSINYE